MPYRDSMSQNEYQAGEVRAEVTALRYHNKKEALWIILSLDGLPNEEELAHIHGWVRQNMDGQHRFHIGYALSHWTEEEAAVLLYRHIAITAPEALILWERMEQRENILSFTIRAGEENLWRLWELAGIGFDVLVLKKRETGAEEMGVSAVSTKEEGAQKDTKAPLMGGAPIVLLGKIFQAKHVVPIIELNHESDLVTVRGKPLLVEVKELKSKRELLLFQLHDGTSTIVVKAFVDKKKGARCIKLMEGECFVTLRGVVEYDARAKDIAIMARDAFVTGDEGRKDTAEKKRVELHAHTKMSAQDGVADIRELVLQAAKFGHPAIAITDHGVVQAFPQAYQAWEEGNKRYGGDMKLIFGMEGYLVNDICYHGTDALLEEYVVFDVETTGLDKKKDRIIEIGACLVCHGIVTKEWGTFIHPGCPIPRDTVELTGITDDMVREAPNIEEGLKDFADFCGEYPLVAHNASFDVAFIRHAGEEYQLSFHNGVLDTLVLSRMVMQELNRHSLAALTSHFQVRLENHHRAVEDAKATAQVCINLIKRAQECGAGESFCSLNGIGDTRGLLPYHAIFLARTQEGLKNLYALVTESHTNGFFRRPLIKKSYVASHRDGLLIGGACEQGEVFRGVLERYDDTHLREIASFYDYLEIQPIENNLFLLDNRRESAWVETEEELREINRQIYLLAQEIGVPCCATCDSHFIHPEDEIFRRILLYIQGFEGADTPPPLYFRNTEEMLAEFRYLGEEFAYDTVVDAPNGIAERIEMGLRPFPEESFFPMEPGAEELLERESYRGAREIYGEQLPIQVEERLTKELGSIIKHGYATLYTSAYHLVKQANQEGYTVGSRGSVGSSLAAFVMGISDVNPLSAHYRCNVCHYNDFDTKSFGMDCGVDLPAKYCPSCGALLVQDGYEIPFEVFLGFEGDKVPDIDLNFSGENQESAFQKVEQMFGRENVYRAGTIIGIQSKTAYGYVMHYMKEHGIQSTKAEIERLTKGLTGVKKTTGAHPGGMIIVPTEINVLDFTPVQYPADKKDGGVITTHFAFGDLHDRLLKLDILGHDNPTIIKRLHEFTGMDPLSVPLNDPKVLSMFCCAEAIVKGETERYGSVTAAVGLPEFGTSFVRGMLEETQPTTVSELIRISGLSHGTNVWLNNAQDLIRSGVATLRECICTRDDVMSGMMERGVPALMSFNIMERVRRGNGLTAEMEKSMRTCDVPEWLVESCKKIEYLFPKSHAAAYVIATLRIGYFKVYYPLAYYGAYFSVRAEEIDASHLIQGLNGIERRMGEIDRMEERSSRYEKERTHLEVAKEMLLRNYSFVPPDLYCSDASKFLPEGERTLRLPFTSVTNLGLSAAESVCAARDQGAFRTIEDLSQRAHLSTAILEGLQKLGTLEGLPQSDQVSLFDFGRLLP